jgi:aryl-alcohol dehydrogenase-like predicted oxidoreductase
MEGGFPVCDYGHIIEDCADRGMGVMAIRVFAAGALVGQEAAPHTHTTKFFPLDLYRRDQQRAAQMQRSVFGEMPMAEAALRFVVGHPSVSSAIIGFGKTEQVDQAVESVEHGALDVATIHRLTEFDYRVE